MSRFNNLAKARPRSEPQVTTVIPHSEPVAKAGASIDSARPFPAFRSAPEQPNILATAGFFVFCLYITSGYLNEWALRYFGGKAYISTVALFLLPVIWLICGNAFRGLRHPIGLWWVGFLVLMLIATPFSIWRSGSVTMLGNYIPRSFLMFFYIAAFATSLARCRSLTFLNIAAGAFVLLSCFKLGDYSDDGRFFVSGSLFFTNSNELALTLLLGATQFGFLFFRRGIGKRVIGVAGILVSIMYMLKTGSRGCMLAAFCVCFLMFIVSRNKVIVLLLAIPVFAIAFLALPVATKQRLMSLGFDTVPVSASEASAVGSQMEREELFKRSLKETLIHPLVGVGPGQFAVAVAGESMKRGEWAPWLGTHNSYTQVSSECGIPAFICYCAVIGWCFRLNYRLYRRTRYEPALTEIAGMSFCLLAATVVYSVATIFFHMAYSGNLPSLAGLSLAVHFSGKSLLEQAQRQAVMTV